MQIGCTGQVYFKDKSHKLSLVNVTEKAKNGGGDLVGSRLST